MPTQSLSNPSPHRQMLFLKNWCILKILGWLKACETMHQLLSHYSGRNRISQIEASQEDSTKVWSMQRAGHPYLGCPPHRQRSATYLQGWSRNSWSRVGKKFPNKSRQQRKDHLLILNNRKNKWLRTHESHHLISMTIVSRSQTIRGHHRAAKESKPHRSERKDPKAKESHRVSGNDRSQCRRKKKIRKPYLRNRLTSFLTSREACSWPQQECLRISQNL